MDNGPKWVMFGLRWPAGQEAPDLLVGVLCREGRNMKTWSRGVFCAALFVVVALAWLPVSSRGTAHQSQPWPPDLTHLVEQPFFGEGVPPPAPVRYMESASQLGGMTDAVAVWGTLVCIGAGPRLLVLDVADPAAPALVGQTDPLPGLVKGVTVTGGLAYAATSEAGLYIVDLTNPTAPSLLGVYDTPSAAHTVAISGTTAFVAATTSGLLIVDVQDPTEPQLLGSLDTPGAATDVVISGGLAYLSDLDFGLRVVDLADPAHPVEIGTLDTPGHAWGLDVAGTTAYVADEIGGLRIVDVADPTHPTLIGAYTDPTNVVDVVVSGTTAYLADWWSGLRMVDVSNPAAPVQLGLFDTDAYVLEVALQSQSSGTTAFLADGDGGLRIVDVTDPPEPAEMGHYAPLGHALNSAVAGSLVYVAGGFSGLHIFDVAEPETPHEIGSYPVSTDCTDVAVVGNMAYLVSRAGGLLVLDVSDPTAPVAVGYRALAGGPRSVVVLDDMAYVAADSGGLRIVDVSVPSNPVEVGFYAIPGTARSVAVRGSTAYVAAGEAGLAVLDVSDPRHPMLVVQVDTPGDATDVTLAGKLAFVADWHSGVRVFDISRPLQPLPLPAIRVPDVAGGVATGLLTPDGWPRVVYVAQGTSGLAAIDYGHPDQPITASYDTPGEGWAVTAVDGTAYVADGAGGLSLVRLYRDQQVATVTAQGGSLAASDGSLIAVFPVGAFTETVTLTYQRLASDEDTGQQLGVGQTYRLRAVKLAGGQPATLAPGTQYAVVLRYTDEELAPIIERTLALHSRQDSGWTVEPSSQLHAQPNAVTALPQRLGWWSLLGNTLRHYLPVLHIAVPRPQPTATSTPMPTATPYYALAFAEDRTYVVTDGSGCISGNGCSLFHIQVRNIGNQPDDYWLTQVPSLPAGWGMFFCWDGSCEYGVTSPPRPILPGARQEASLTFRLPTGIEDGQVGTVRVTGHCTHCPSPSYDTRFTVRIAMDRGLSSFPAPEAWEGSASAAAGDLQRD